MSEANYQEQNSPRYPKITIDLSKITHNTCLAADACHKYGIRLIGVTKACLGSPQVALAMLAGGAAGLGDSRIENLAALRSAGIEVPLTMLRLPMKSEVEAVVSLSDISLNSDMEVIFALGRAAVGINRTHRIVVMIDTGDGREGVAPEAAIPFIRDAGRISGIEVAGVGTNFTCLRGKAPDKENLSVLAGIAGQAAEEIGPNGITVSGGNSSAWNMLRDGRIPPEVNELRMGEALLLGRETARGELIEGFCHDAFAIEAEVIEAPPSRPGHFIAAVGRQDIDEGSLFPADSETEIVKASSDHLVLRRGGTAPAAGETVRFVPGYDSLLRVMTSPYVRKEYI